MCERGFTGATIAAISHDEQALARDDACINHCARGFTAASSRAITAAISHDEQAFHL